MCFFAKHGILFYIPLGEDMKMRIKVKLQEVLDERGISQRQLALMVNMRPGTINALCRGTTDRIYISTLEQICKALNIHIHALIVMEDE
jgi:putative transcriptional regulator